MKNRKYIFISGGIISGVGKGIAASSIGFLLKARGLRVSMIKADPYLNVDAGTMNPLEHGETFVLEDGLETDMDMGNYERFLGEMLSGDNYMTSGSIYRDVIEKERSMHYRGKCVQIYSHIPAEIIEKIKYAGEKDNADVVVIEIGGTVGEYEAELFLEANRILKLSNPNDVVHMHVAYLPIPSTVGEMKTKPTQTSVKSLFRQGIVPDFILARSSRPVDAVRKEKISYFCNIPTDNVISAPDVANIYEVPVNFEKDKLTDKLIKQLGIKAGKGSLLKQWSAKVKKMQGITKEVTIGIVGKYYKSGDFDLQDSYVSVIEALKHAAWEEGVRLNIDWIVSDGLEGDKEAQRRIAKLDGMIVPQGWGSRGVEGKIAAVKIAREKKIPYLGLCFGMQMAVIEFARNQVDLKDANSEEADPKSPHKVVHLMKNQKELIESGKYGGTIRLGGWKCMLLPNSLLDRLYKKYDKDAFVEKGIVSERHRHRYEFNNKYRDEISRAGLVISGTSPDGQLVEAIELPESVHPFFVATQFHPELKSQFLKPHPLFRGFVDAVKARL